LYRGLSVPGLVGHKVQKVLFCTCPGMTFRSEPDSGFIHASR